MSSRLRGVTLSVLTVLLVALAGCGSEPEVVYAPDLPEVGSDPIIVGDTTVVASTEDGPPSFQTNHYDAPITVVPVDASGNAVDADLNVYLAEGDDGELAIWLLDESDEPTYLPYYFRGRLDERLSDSGYLEPQFVCAGVCFTVAAVLGVSAVGGTLATGILAGAKHDIEAVTEISDAESTGLGTWYSYCKTIPEITAMVDGVHTLETLPRDVAGDVVLSIISGVFRSVADIPKYAATARTVGGILDARDVWESTVGSVEAGSLMLSLYSARAEDYGTEVEWDVRVFIPKDEGQFGWRHREFHIYGPCDEAGIDETWKADLRVLGSAPVGLASTFQLEASWDAAHSVTRRPILQVAYLDAAGGYLESRRYIADTYDSANGLATFDVDIPAASQAVASVHIGVNSTREVTGSITVPLSDENAQRPSVVEVSYPTQAPVNGLVTIDYIVNGDVGRDIVCEVDYGDGTVDVDQNCGTGSSTHAYDTRATHTFTLSVYYVDMPNDTTVVQGSIEVTDRRTHVLGECDAWTPWIEGGGAGLTADTWDVSALAADTLVAIEIDAYSIPDRFQIRYADLYVLWDSGWRGSGAGASTEVVLEATRIEPSWDEMQVYVNGSESGTAWQYRLNCQAP